MSSTEKLSPRQLFSERLRTLRLERKLKSIEMAAFLGFSGPVYSRYENGRLPKTDTVAVIAKKMNISVDWLLGRTEKMNYSEISLPGNGGEDAVMRMLDRLESALAACVAAKDLIAAKAIIGLIEERKASEKTKRLT